MSASSTPLRFAGLTIVVTGASSGIGEAAARQLAAAGARVCLVARRVDELDRVREAIEEDGGDCAVYPGDLADPVGRDAVADAILHDEPRIDVLVNNAGRSIRRPIEQSLDRLHDYERTIQLNYLGAVGLTLRLLPRFLAQGRGQVINSSSVSVQLPVPRFSATVASKAALDAFARSLAAELGDRGIAVTTIHFPLVRTPMSLQTELYRHLPMMHVDDAAAWIVDAVARRPTRIGPAWGVVGGVALAALPGPLLQLGRGAFQALTAGLERRAHRHRD